MDLRIYNSLTRNVELFEHSKDTIVRMYTCGPTVYDNTQLGNFRTFILNDLLKRALLYAGYKVSHVMNVTDFGHLVGDAEEGEDKMTKGLKREGRPLTMESMLTFAGEYAKKFEDDMVELNILPPSSGLVRASDHIAEDIELIKRLESKGVTYKISTGLYFDTSKFPNYGKLGNVKLGDTDGARIATNPEKRNPQDFVLWRTDANLGWDSVWGKGFPGWHIECSAMAMKYLGESIDIHTGGIDLLPTHHNNEIAQSETATGKQFSTFWVHGEHLQLASGRMGKSLGNAITLKDLKEKGMSPLDFRYLTMMTHYRQKQCFTWEALASARTARLRLRDFAIAGQSSKLSDENHLHEFKEELSDDLNMPKAVAELWELVKSDVISEEERRASLKKADEVLALGLFDNEPETPATVLSLLSERNVARNAKDWALSDELRQQIEALGYEVMDNGDTSTVRTLR